MQLEELQRQWKSLDEKLEQTLKLDRELFRLTVSRSTRRRMSRQAVWPVLDLGFGLLVMVLTGSFLGNHWGAWSLVGPAIVVMIAASLLLAASIHQLHGIAEIDWCGSVVEIQSALSRLHLARIRQFKWVILLSPLVGFCGLLVGLQSLLDRLPAPVLIFDQLNPWWVASNYAFGLLFIPFGHRLVRLLARRFQDRAWWRRVLADLSGTSMRRAREELAHWTGVDH